VDASTPTSLGLRSRLVILLLLIRKVKFIPAPVFSPSVTTSAQVNDGGRDAPGRLDDHGA
jgi:hypothetical protein